MMAHMVCYSCSRSSVRAAAMGASAFGGNNLDVKTAPQDELPVIVRERRAMQVGRVSGMKTPPLRVKPRGARACVS